MYISLSNSSNASSFNLVLQRLECHTREHVLFLGTLLGVQDYKKGEFSGRDNSSLAVKG